MVHLGGMTAVSKFSLFFGTLLLVLGIAGARVDPASPTTARTTTRRHDGRELALVFSDEFENEGRSFAPGDDDHFEAQQWPDDTNQAIQFYNSSREYVTTRDGALRIRTKAVKTTWEEWDASEQAVVTRSKNYTSGMIQSWNKLCFTGGVLEMQIELPGAADSGGLWPAAWLMGNLARAGFKDSVLAPEEGVGGTWPWSYDRCETDNKGTSPASASGDKGVAPAMAGFDPRGKQEVSACDAAPGFGMHPYQGRGAPELDVFEVMPGHEMPDQGAVKAFMSSSLQVSPGLPADAIGRPVNGKALNASYTWYSPLQRGGKESSGRDNSGFWGQTCGPEQDPSLDQRHKWMEDAISYNSDLSASEFSRAHTYRLEWQPGGEDGQGYVEWYLDDQFIFGVPGTALRNLTGAMVPVEPMYLILNTAISHRWGMPEPCPADSCGACWQCYDCSNPDCQCALPEGMRGCANLPAEMSVSYVRVYQDAADADHTLGCSPPHFPTQEWIAGHADRYKDWAPLPNPGEWRALAGLRVSLLLGGVLGLMMAAKQYYLRQRPQYNMLPASAVDESSHDGQSELEKGVEIIPAEAASADRPLPFQASA